MLKRYRSDVIDKALGILGLCAHFSQSNILRGICISKHHMTIKATHPESNNMNEQEVKSQTKLLQEEGHYNQRLLKLQIKAHIYSSINI